MEFFENSVFPYFNYWIYVILMMIGMHAMITKNNLIKKLIGMTIFQTAIILFYVSIGVKEGATIPILDHHGSHEAEHHAEAPAKPGAAHDAHGEKKVASEEHPHPEAHAESADQYANPLPHVLMLTAIVVGVSTLGVALAVTQSIFRDFGSLEEDEILAKIKEGGNGTHV